MPNKPNRTGKSPRGKHWTVEEEEYYWQVMIPKSPKSVDDNPKEELSWEECAEEMHEKFKKEKHRIYTSGCLSEHWYQNVRNRCISPKAWPYVTEYLPKWEARKAEEEQAAAAAAMAKAGAEVEVGGGTAADATEETEPTLKERNALRRLGKRRRMSDAETESPIDPALQLAGRGNKRIKIVRRPAAPVAKMHRRATG